MEYSKILQDINRFSSQELVELDNAYITESEDRKLKRDLRTKLNHKEDNIKNPQDIKKLEILAKINIVKNHIQLLEEQAFTNYFPETKQIFNSIHDLVIVKGQHPNFVLNSLNQRKLELEKLQKKYSYLLFESNERKTDLNETFNYYSKNINQYNIVIKSKIDEVEEALQDHLIMEILSHENYQSSLKRILEIKEMMDEEDSRKNEQEYIQSSLVQVLEDLEYEIEVTEDNEESSYSDVQKIELPINDEIRIRIEIGQRCGILAQVIFLTNEEELSEQDLSDIQGIVKDWEIKYEKMGNKLKDFGIALNKDWMEELTEDTIVIEKKKSESEFHRKQISKLKQRTMEL
jgi:hypothetical protein